MRRVGLEELATISTMVTEDQVRPVPVIEFQVEKRNRAREEFFLVFQPKAASATSQIREFDGSRISNWIVQACLPTLHPTLNIS